MKPLPALCRIALVALVSLSAATSHAADSKPLHVLFFNKSSGFEHSVIKLIPDVKDVSIVAPLDGKLVAVQGKRIAPTFAGGVLKEIAAKNNMEITETKDGTIFTSPDLAKFDVFLFYTTGDLTKDSKDGKGMGDDGKIALLNAIKGGKGFVALHCGSDTFHSKGPKKPGSEDTEKVDPYIAMLGGEFISHGAQQKAKMVCVDNKFPGFAEVGPGFEIQEEWYALKNFPADLHVILVQDNTGMNGPVYQRPPYPATWARKEGKGRVFYTSMGHREDVWTNPIFQNALVGALNWTGRRVEADITPNIDKVAPHAHEYPAPAPPKPAEPAK